MIFTRKVKSLRIQSAAAVAGMPAPRAAQANIAGNIDLVTKYALWV
ncbi:MAG: hypothetical protein ACYDDO_13685 [Acidiferrobacterales bacterium]